MIDLHRDPGRSPGRDAVSVSWRGRRQGVDVAKHRAAAWMQWWHRESLYFDGVGKTLWGLR